MAPAANRTKKPYSRPAGRPQGAEGQWLHDKAPGVPRAVQNTVAKPATGITNTRIIVSNLHYEVTPKDLSQIFGQIGTLVREPQIRYDRSGRSSGVAVITFETPAEATRAKKQFDGILCKNQPMSIAYDNSPPPARRSASTSLLNRIEKPPLLDRLSKTESKTQRPAPSQAGVGPVRTKQRPNPGTANARASKRLQPPKPKTAEELDKELDAFMKDEITADSVPAAVGTGAGGDVEMS
ncbi:RNA-binding domain-containing protein [Lentinus tigrinus ALCF2SS1-6]|uniref:RNA-binding domain-containing protein n=1 Tax=Lentinus tigrinus ALCF2SS1-6 TaxID=1328759 RepID=A0A5C2RYA9_9APHY|nr:RNA-binding domain-containing protein [Lentinus tigrinus ALCF2SS1-6]